MRRFPVNEEAAKRKQQTSENKIEGDRKTYKITYDECHDT